MSTELGIDEAELVNGEVTLTGRITTASNATFFGTIGDVAVVYKPVAGEQPLWDFPDGTLAAREVAAYAVSEALQWNIVPRTWLRDGPLGPGMTQLWQEPDAEHEPVTLVAGGQTPSGWCHVIDGVDQDDRPVSLVHEDTAALRRIAVFDVLINNADRKGGHVLPRSDGHRFGIDHGVAFHTEHKLRTVLWGWLHQTLTEPEICGVERVLSAVNGQLGVALRDLLSTEEIEAFAQRCERLLTEPRFPAPSGPMPAVPWPPF